MRGGIVPGRGTDSPPACHFSLSILRIGITFHAAVLPCNVEPWIILAVAIVAWRCRRVCLPLVPCDRRARDRMDGILCYRVVGDSGWHLHDMEKDRLVTFPFPGKSRNDRKDDVRRPCLVVVDHLLRDGILVLVAVRQVGVHGIPREVARGYNDAHAVAGLEEV